MVWTNGKIRVIDCLAFDDIDADLDSSDIHLLSFDNLQRSQTFGGKT